MAPPSLKDCGYWGVLNYAQIWLWSDALILGEVASDEGKFTPASLDHLLRVYAVRRGFPALSQAKDRKQRDLGAVVRLANEQLAAPPKSLADRAEVCMKFAEAMQSDGLTVGRQYSAATKMSWFLSPESWTVYDSYVARAIGAPNLQAFYFRIERLGGRDGGFERVCARIRSVLDGTDWAKLSSARIIDGILLNRGAMAAPGDTAISERHAARLCGFVNGLPGNTGPSLIKCASEVQEVMLELGLGERLE